MPQGVPLPTSAGETVVGKRASGAPMVEGGMSVGVRGAGAATMGLTPALPISTDAKGIPVRATLPPARFSVLVEDVALLLKPGAQTTVPLIDEGVAPKDIPPPS